MVETVEGARPTGYGLGRHGWVTIDLPKRVGGDRWAEVSEWILTSYALVASKTLARQVMEAHGGQADT